MGLLEPLKQKSSFPNFIEGSCYGLHAYAQSPYGSITEM